MKITTSLHGQNCIEIENPTQKVRQIIKSVLTANHFDDPDYQACQLPRPFLQCDTEDYMLIEFWGTNVPEFVSYLQEKISVDV